MSTSPSPRPPIMGRRPRRPPLFAAVLSASHPDRVRRCLEQDPQSVHARDAHRNTATHLAAGCARSGVVALLLEAAPDSAAAVNALGDTPLHCAAYGGNARAVPPLAARAHETLVSTNLAGDTPLMAATRAGHPAVARKLLDAAPSAILLPDGQGRTPLSVAVQLYAACPRGKLTARGDLTCRAGLVLALLERTHPDPDDGALTALLRALLDAAALAGHHPIVRRVLELDPGAAAPSRPAPHPIHLAASRGHVEVLEALLAAEPGLATLEGERGRRPLHEAVTSGSLAAVSTVLRAAPDSATRLDTHGMSALSYAAVAGDGEMVGALLEAAPSMAEAPDECGRLPLHLAAWADSCPAIGRLLASAPHTAAARDGHGLNALHHAIVLRSARACEALLERLPHLAATTTALGQSCADLALAEDACDDAATAAVLRPVLARQPSLATAACLHRAVQLGLPACVAVVLAAAPGVVQSADALGRTAIDAALHGARAEVALALAGTRHPDPLLLFLQLANFGAPAEAFVRAIEAHVPLPPGCWRVVPGSLPGLLHVLPAVIERGTEADVGEAVARMDHREQLFLKESIRALHRAARALPVELTRQILCMAV